MLLHELQHCRQKDTRIVFLMNLAGILYWFNPFVWYALKEMRCDRELSCDSAVLHLLDETDYQAYGNTLINFAEKISHIPFPYATGMSGSMKQLSCTSARKAAASSSEPSRVVKAICFCSRPPAMEEPEVTASFWAESCPSAASCT